MYLTEYTTVLFFVCSVCIHFSVYNLISPVLLYDVYTTRRDWLRDSTKGRGTHAYEVSYDPSRRILISTLWLLAVNVVLVVLASLIAMSEPHVSFVGRVDCEDSVQCQNAMIRADAIYSTIVGGLAVMGFITCGFTSVLAILCAYEMRVYRKRIQQRQRIAQDAQEQFVQRIGFSPRSAAQMVDRVQDSSHPHLGWLRHAMRQLDAQSDPGLDRSECVRGGGGRSERQRTQVELTEQDVVSGVPVYVGY